MKQGKTIIALIWSAIVMILRYNNVSNAGSASYRMQGVKHEDFFLLKDTHMRPF